jgi:UDP-GlcNAc:undecaprenyl-phosphate GlcNAc-1-phosphate transferase
MGDAGALFLGTLIASLLVRYDPNPIDRLTSFSIPILLLAIPILDTTVAVVSRLRRRKSPFHGGKDHLSHRLMRFGFSRKKTAITLWALTGFFGSLALVISNAPYNLERTLLYLGTFIWIVLIAFFLRQRDE